jgi:hypothetical protein
MSIREAMTCRLFIDEVGNGDLRGAAADDNVRYLSLTGILTKIDLHERAISPLVNDLKVDIFGTADVILHRREIVRREGIFSLLRNKEKAQSFDAALLGLIKDCPYLAITISIDKREHLERYSTWHFDPYHYCLRCLIERYVMWLRRHKLTGDVAIEPRFPKVDKKVKKSFQIIYEQGTQHISATAVREHLLSRDIKFIPKRSNVAGMQLCDLLAHPSYRSMKLERLGLPEPPDFGTDIVEILRRHRYSRHPKSQKISGWGRKWLP